MRGQLGAFQHKSVKPIALDAGVPPKSLQQFLAIYTRDDPAMARRVRHIVHDEHGLPDEIGISKTPASRRTDRRQSGPAAVPQLDGQDRQLRQQRPPRLRRSRIPYARRQRSYIPKSWFEDPLAVRRRGSRRIWSSGRNRRWGSIDLLNRTLGDGVPLSRLEPPRFFIRDGDGKYGSVFDEIARAAGIRCCVTSTPLENAYAERFIRTVRQEILQHFAVVGEKHLRWILGEYIRHYNRQRPHQGIDQQIPAEVEQPVARPRRGRIVRDEILNGLIVEYRRAA